MEDQKIKMTEMYDSLSIHKYTSVFHEASYTNNAPHHYMIVDKNSIGEDRDNVTPRLLGSIDFQNGPIKEATVNGVMDENLIAIVINRLQHFQDSAFACQENEMALLKLTEGLMWLKKRTADRELRKVEGTNAI